MLSALLLRKGPAVIAKLLMWMQNCANRATVGNALFAKYRDVNSHELFSMGPHSRLRCHCSGIYLRAQLSKFSCWVDHSRLIAGFDGA
jgi:hypothetical protein